MTFSRYLFPVLCVVSVGSLGCPSSGTLSGGGSALDAGDALAPPQDTEKCQGDVARCLAGTASFDDFDIAPAAVKVDLYRVFPSGAATPLHSIPLAKDGTFAFSTLDPWAHYYVQVVAKFDPAKDSVLPPVSVLRGPLTVPGANDALKIAVRPVELEVLEGKLGSSAMMVEWAKARVFDPANGHELTDAVVSIAIGGSNVTLPYVTAPGAAKAYFVQFPQGTAASATYAMTTTHAALGANLTTWSLLADPPTYDAHLTTPADGMTVSKGAALHVSWTAEPLADYAFIELFAKQASTFTSRYASPAALAPDVVEDNVPATAIDAAGTYLLNLELTKSNCPATATGCVHAHATAAANLTAN